MSISSLLDGGGREIRYRSRVGKRHLRKDGLDTKTSSHSSKPAEELRRQTTTTSQILVGGSCLLKGDA